MIYTVNSFINFMEQAVTDAWGYVYGANGELYTMEAAQALYASSVANGWGYSEEYYTVTQYGLWANHHVADCSGLIYAFRQESDSTANTLYVNCTSKGKFANFDGRAGVLLFDDDGGTKTHVAITVGRGKLIHSKNSETGVVKESISASTRWTHYGIPNWINYAYSRSTALSISSSSSVTDVCWLQQRLNYHTNSSLVVDGSYGSLTASAYVTFAEANGLAYTQNGYYVNNAGIVLLTAG